MHLYARYTSYHHRQSLFKNVFLLFENFDFFRFFPRHQKGKIGLTSEGASYGSALQYKINLVTWLQIQNDGSQSQPLLKSKLLEKSKNTYLLKQSLYRSSLPLLFRLAINNQRPLYHEFYSRHPKSVMIKWFLVA